MRWGRLVGLGVALTALLPSQASAEITALATRSGEQAPVLTDGRVLWSTRAGASGIRVFSRLAGGGPTQLVGRATLPKADGRLFDWTLVAAPGWIGLRAHARAAHGDRLFAGAGGALDLVRSNVPEGRRTTSGRDTWAGPAKSFVTLERRMRDAVVTDAAGAHRTLALPPKADAATLTASNGRAAVVAGSEVDVLDIATGAIERRVAFGAFQVERVISLSISPEGDLAITGEDGEGRDGLGWAPAGATQFEIVTVADNFGLVQTAGGRIAMVGPNGARFTEGQRVFVFEPRPGGQEPSLLFQSPPAEQIEGLDFDGAHVAWAIQDACQLVADALPADSNLVMPPGPCIRSQVTTGTFVPPKLKGASIGVEFRCLTAPTNRCRLTVGALAFPNGGGRARPIGRTHTTVPRGKSRLVYVPITRRDAARLRHEQLDPIFPYTVTDPDGRERSDVAF
jgi:hypothetical protein